MWMGPRPMDMDTGIESAMIPAIAAKVATLKLLRP